MHDEVSYFTSFYYYALTGGVRDVLHAWEWPRISLRRVFDEARDYASNPCVLPRPTPGGVRHVR